MRRDRKFILCLTAYIFFYLRQFFLTSGLIVGPTNQIVKPKLRKIFSFLSQHSLPDLASSSWRDVLLFNIFILRNPLILFIPLAIFWLFSILFNILNGKKGYRLNFHFVFVGLNRIVLYFKGLISEHTFLRIWFADVIAQIFTKEIDFNK